MSYTQMFWSIVKETFAKLIELHPEQSVNLGLGVLDKPLPDLSPNSIPIEKGLIQIQLEKLEEVKVNSLPVETKVDFYAFKDYLRLRLFFIDDWPLWKMYPDAPEVAFSMILSVYLSDDISPKEKMNFIIGKLEELPVFLEKSKSRLQVPVQIFIDSGILSSKNLISLIKGIYNDFVSNLDLSKKMVSSKNIFDKAVEITDSYIAWLQGMRSKEIRDYAMGNKLYEKLLHRRRVYYSLSELEKNIKKDLEYYKAKLLKTCEEIKKGSSPKEVLEFISEESPKTSSVALTLYQQGMLEVKRVILEKNLLTLPDIEVSIEPVPSMIRDVMPLIFYFPSFQQISELKGVKVFINVSDDPELLMLHNVYLSLHRILRMIFPGYHVIFTRSILERNYVRMLLDLPEVMEGWSLYADYIVGEHGFLDSPKDKFIRLLTLYQNALLAYLDIKVNIGEMTHLKALNHLVEEGFMDKNEAVTHILKIIISPSTSLSPYFGFKGLWNMRESLRILLGEDYNDKWFHDNLLKYAILPVDLLKILLVNEASQLLLNKAMEYEEKI